MGVNVGVGDGLGGMVAVAVGSGVEVVRNGSEAALQLVQTRATSASHMMIFLYI